MTKAQIKKLEPLPFEQKVAHTRYADGTIVDRNIKVWGQDNDGKWGWVNHTPRFKKGKFERGFYPVPKKPK